VAALLHDTLEDTDYTAEELENDFGKTVRKYVEAVSEPKYDKDEKLSWSERKKRYAEQLRKAPLEAVMISAADKAHNFRSMVEEYYHHHTRFVQDFGPDQEKRLEAYQRIANAVNSRLKDGIVHEFNHTFDQYKQFIFDVQESQTPKP
jgi:(p)ppGpp synthase/HD superfamily hydrolase